MKKHFFLVILVLLALFSAGCGPQGMTDKGANYVISDHDSNFFEKGTSKLDLDYCEDIVDKKLRTDCVNIVESKTIIGTALEENNEKLCKDIKIAEYKDVCIKEVQNKKKEDEMKKKEREKADEKANEMSERQAEIVKTGDASKCKTLEDEAYQRACEYIISENAKNTEE